MCFHLNRQLYVAFFCFSLFCFAVNLTYYLVALHGTEHVVPLSTSLLQVMLLLHSHYLQILGFGFPVLFVVGLKSHIVNLLLRSAVIYKIFS